MLLESVQPPRRIQHPVQVGPLQFVEQTGIILDDEGQFGRFQEFKPFTGVRSEGEPAEAILGALHDAARVGSR